MKFGVLGKIKQEYTTNEAIEDFIRDLVGSTRCNLQFNESEIGEQGDRYMIRMVHLCLPEYNDPTNFREKFTRMFQNVVPGSYPKEEVSFNLNQNQNQIVVVAVTAGFPLRLVSNVAVLKEKYQEKLVGQNAALNKMILHTESFENDLPDLYENSIENNK